MKRNILISDPTIPTFRYTFVLDLSDLYIAFSRSPGKFVNSLPSIERIASMDSEIEKIWGKWVEKIPSHLLQSVELYKFTKHWNREKIQG